MQNGTIEMTWADGDRVFNVARIALLLELEEKCGAGLATVYGRLVGKAWTVNDVRETIRLGLIGGGLAPAAALALVKRYVDDGPQRIGLIENAMTALAIVQAAMLGVRDDPVGKKPTGRHRRETDVSAAPSSMAPAPPSELPLG